MPKPTRDPAREPKRGDLLRANHGATRTVTAFDGKTVEYMIKTADKPLGLRRTCKLITWTRWCQATEADILKKAGRPVKEAA